jgi:hypothetical protein
LNLIFIHPKTLKCRQQSALTPAAAIKARSRLLLQSKRAHACCCNQSALTPAAAIKARSRLLLRPREGTANEAVLVLNAVARAFGEQIPVKCNRNDQTNAGPLQG